MKINTLVLDWKGTLFNTQTKELFPFALEFLIAMRMQDIYLLLYDEKSDINDIEIFGIQSLFNSIKFVDQKSITDFIFVKNVIFIGDRIGSEIEIGNRLGAITMLIRKEKETKKKPKNIYQKPTNTVKDLKECLKVINSLQGRAFLQ